jgi:hypothetical protein
MEDSEVEQSHVNSLLWRGVFFSIVWLAGIGSFIAVRRGLQARKLIKQSNGRLHGAGKVWWCLIVGGFGLALWGGLLVTGIVVQIFNHFSPPPP